MTSTGGFPAADITGRMAVFGRLFGEQAGIPETTRLATPQDVIAVVKGRVPRSGGPADDAPIVEAAAYVGEWMRARAQGIWVAEGPFEPHLQLVDASHAIVILVPLVSILRTATTAGYDGLGDALEAILDDVSRPARRGPLDRLMVEPPMERAKVVAWVRRSRGLRHAARAALWRRCATCGRRHEEELAMRLADDAWEGEAAAAATILAKRPFACDCGGLPGDTSRFLMLRAAEGATRLCDIHVNALRSRVATWTLEDEEALPFDATTLANLTGPR
jgi:hypothetical protein